MVVYSTAAWKGVKNLALKSARGNFEKTMRLTSDTTGLGLVVAQHYACLSLSPHTPCWVDLIF